MKAMYAMNEKLNGIEITFEGKPSDAIRKMMKDEGYRWHRVKQLWYAKYTENREKVAKQVCKDAKKEKVEDPEKKAPKKKAKKTEVVNSAQNTETPKKVAPTVLKTKKIRNVPKDVCVGECMIAYNYAFSWHHIIQDELEKCKDEVEKSKVTAQWIDKILKWWVRDYPKQQKSFNLDAIKVALNQGLRKYIDKPFIASDYVQVGKCFKVPYTE